jgi:hypothetical protein
MTPQEEQQEWIRRRREAEKMRTPGLPCSLTQPLLMVIPPDGVILPCPIHAQGHFIAPSIVTY